MKLSKLGKTGSGLLRRLRVLIVEDSENDALLVVRELKQGGYEVDYERVETPEGLEKALAASEWDVVVSDYRMPRFGALEALRVARDAGSDAPFIVVSGKVGEEAAVEVMKAGADDFLTKDNLARLCPTVQRGLAETEKRRHAGEELRRRDAVLDAVRFATEHFLGNPTDRGMEEVLERLGQATETSRVYVFRNHLGEDGRLWNAQLHKWVAPGVTPGFLEDESGSLLLDFPYRDDGSGRWTDFGRWEEVLGRGEPMYGNVLDFPEHERPFLGGKLGIKSMIIVPILVEEEWWGFIGFDDCSREREWSAAEIDALKAAASTLGAALQRQAVEEELRSSETRYRAVIEQATDGIYILDAETRRVVESNPSYQKMLGYTVSELLGMQVYDFVAHPREDVDATIERTLEQRRRLVGERKYRRKDGILLHVEVGVSVISLDGRDMICTIVRDVTERKQAEEDLKQSEKLYRTVIEQATENICLVDIESRCIVESNTAFREALGYTEAELRGMTLYDVVAHDRQSVDRNVEQTIHEGRSFVGQRRYRRKDGSLLEVEASGSIILRHGRETLCVVAHDVTERARAHRLLEERVATLSRIAANLAFDVPAEDTLDSLAESAVKASTAVACGVVLVDRKDETLHLFGSYGLPEGYTQGLQASYRLGAPSPSLKAFRTQEPVLLRDLRRFLLEDQRYAPIHRFVREVPWDITYSLPLPLPLPDGGRYLFLLPPSRGARRGRAGLPQGRSRPDSGGSGERPPLLRGSRQGSPRRETAPRKRAPRLGLPGPLRHSPRRQNRPQAGGPEPPTRRRPPRVRALFGRRWSGRDAGADLRAQAGVPGERGARSSPGEAGGGLEGTPRDRGRGSPVRGARSLPRGQGGHLPHSPGGPAQHGQARPGEQRNDKDGV